MVLGAPDSQHTMPHAWHVPTRLWQRRRSNDKYQARNEKYMNTKTVMMLKGVGVHNTFISSQNTRH